MIDNKDFMYKMTNGSEITTPVQFLYARDIRLDRPFSGGAGMAEIPFFRLRNTAFVALRRLIDCALERKVDFVLLAGCLCDSACGKETPAALMEQLARLSAAGIRCHILRENVEPWMEIAFPSNVDWLNKEEENFSIVKDGKGIVLSLPPILAVSSKPLQACSPDEDGANGAWLITLCEDGSEKEFIACDALRWASRKLDVATLGSGEGLASAWEKMREELRAWGDGRPVLAQVELTGRSGWRDFFEGEDFDALIKKLNAGEAEREDFVILDSVADKTFLPDLSHFGNWSFDLEKFPVGRSLESDFFQELLSFKSQIDPRLTLFDILKERGGRAPSEAASFLENLTEASLDFLLQESCREVLNGLFTSGSTF